jgi:hypothetical protein
MGNEESKEEMSVNYVNSKNPRPSYHSVRYGMERSILDLLGVEKGYPKL